jgi:ATP-binding cassette subfamily B protein
MGSVLESEALEALALSGGFLALLGGIELLFALGVLTMGAASFVHPIVLAATVATALTFAWSYVRDRRAWTDQRLAMTHALIEKIVGHRTRTVQEPAEERHVDEDRSLDVYARLSRRLDRRAVLLLGLVPRGWLLVALGLLAPAFVQGATTASLAIALGGTLLAHRALTRTTAGLTSLADAAISWREVKPMLDAARSEEPPGASPPGPASSESTTILEARNLRYTHRGRCESVLERCSLEIKRGERILLSGASGSGKSTLLSVLSGLRAGQNGLTLLEGRDARTAGAGAWRAKVGAVLQLHEDHLFSAPFHFNLAAGHRWPPSCEDMRQAASLCRELKLDGLLERMPGRFDQVVGEGGWRLSHGERARLCIARALLRTPGLLVADESFGALDGDTQRRALEATQSRVPALLVVAHG